MKWKGHHLKSSIPLTEDALMGKSAAVSATSHNAAGLFISNISQSRSKFPDDTDRHSPLCLCLLKYKFTAEQLLQFLYNYCMCACVCVNYRKSNRNSVRMHAKETGLWHTSVHTVNGCWGIPAGLFLIFAVTNISVNGGTRNDIWPKRSILCKVLLYTWAQSKPSNLALNDIKRHLFSSTTIALHFCLTNWPIFRVKWCMTWEVERITPIGRLKRPGGQGQI